MRKAAMKHNGYRKKSEERWQEPRISGQELLRGYNVQHYSADSAGKDRLGK